MNENLEKWTDVDVESEIGETGGDDFGATIVPVLTHFGHQNTRTTSLQRHQLVDLIVNWRPKEF